jgi:excisionase family DNA binding protein
MPGRAKTKPRVKAPRAVRRRAVGDGDIFTVDEAALELRVSRWLMYKLVGRGEVLSLKVGRRRFVPGWAINEFVRRPDVVRRASA